jgi:hypothetical protein
MRPKEATRTAAWEARDAVRIGNEPIRQRLRPLEHQRASMRMQGDGMAIGDHSPNDQRGLAVHVLWNHEERRYDPLARQNIEQRQCGRRVRTVLVGEVDRRSAVARWHVPHGAAWTDPLQSEWERIVRISGVPAET